MEGNSKTEIECKQIVKALSLYAKQSTMLKNKLHGESVLGNPSKLVVSSLRRNLNQLKKAITTLVNKLLILVKQTHQDLLTRLKTIPDIGPKNSYIDLQVQVNFVVSLD